MEIVIDLLHMDDSIKRMKSFKNEFDQKVYKTIRNIGTFGLDQAKTNFSRAQYDGTNDVTVTGSATMEKGEIVASGRSVLFIEFGTGVHYASNPHPNAYEFGYFPGSYGPNGLKDYWLYKGEAGTNGVPSTANPKMIFTRGNPPNRCMYNTGKAIETQMPRIVREVFK